MIRTLLNLAVKHLPLRRITRGGDEALYLDRYYLLGKLPQGFPSEFPERLGFLPFTLFLHHFLASDQEEELHNHPWDRSFSLVLAGGYREERKDPFERTTSWRTLRPFAINTIASGDYHRVHLLEKDAWTLFFTGKKTQSWEFWSPKTNEFIPWRNYRVWKREERERVLRKLGEAFRSKLETEQST